MTSLTRPGRPLATCGCTRLEFADGDQGILIAAAEFAGRVMPLAERLQRLVEGVDPPIAAFARDGTLIGANFAVSANPEDETAPTVSAASATGVIVGYDKYLKSNAQAVEGDAL